jgi:hypothetical protein
MSMLSAMSGRPAGLPKPIHVSAHLGDPAAGHNDIRRHGYAAVRLVSQEETRRNIDGLGRLVTGDMGARLVRMILPPVHAATAAEWPDLQKQSLS